MLLWMYASRKLRNNTLQDFLKKDNISGYVMEKRT